MDPEILAAWLRDNCTEELESFTLGRFYNRKSRCKKAIRLIAEKLSNEFVMTRRENR